MLSLVPEFTVSLGPASPVPNHGGVRMGERDNLPIHKFSVVHNPRARASVAFSSWWTHMPQMTRGRSPQPEEQFDSYLSFQPSASGFDDRAAWFESVHVVPGQPNPGNLVAIYRAESASTGCYVHSTGVAHSNDSGITWTRAGQALSPYRYPAIPTSSLSPRGSCAGPQDARCRCVQRAGGGSALWDEPGRRWVLAYSSRDTTADGISVAASSDRWARPGSWRKMSADGAFVEPGLSGAQSAASRLLNGSSPALHWNTYLGAYVVAYNSGERGVVQLSASYDLRHWSDPVVIASGEEGAASFGASNPTILGERDDKSAARLATVYYMLTHANLSKVGVARALAFQSTRRGASEL